MKKWAKYHDILILRVFYYKSFTQDKFINIKSLFVQDFNHSSIEFGRWHNCIIQRLPNTLPFTISNRNPINILQTWHSLLFVPIVLDRASFGNIRKTKDDHYIIDEFNFDSQLQQDCGTSYILTEVFGIVLDDVVTEVEEEVQEAVVKSQDQASSLY